MRPISSKVAGLSNIKCAELLYTHRDQSHSGFTTARGGNNSIPRYTA